MRGNCSYYCLTIRLDKVNNDLRSTMNFVKDNLLWNGIGYVGVLNYDIYAHIRVSLIKSFNNLLYYNYMEDKDYYSYMDTLSLMFKG